MKISGDAVAGAAAVVAGAGIVALSTAAGMSETLSTSDTLWVIASSCAGAGMSGAGVNLLTVVLKKD